MTKGWHGLSQLGVGEAAQPGRTGQPGRRLRDRGRRNSVAGADVATGPDLQLGRISGCPALPGGRIDQNSGESLLSVLNGLEHDVGPRCGVDDLPDQP